MLRMMLFSCIGACKRTGIVDAVLIGDQVRIEQLLIDMGRTGE